MSSFSIETTSPLEPRVYHFLNDLIETETATLICTRVNVFEFFPKCSLLPQQLLGL